MSCNCQKCSEIDKKEREVALEKWNNGVRDIKINHWEWTCGDGCCYDSGSDLYVNGCLLGDISGGYQYTILSMMDFLGYTDVYIEDDGD